jgi:prepilin-type N-terminal cleavage/methylation domain-containing protein
MKIRKSRAFTLIELLVVISIIAVLMSIMMPALGKVRKMAQRTVCLTSQRSIGVALNLYVLDNDNRFSNNRFNSPSEDPKDSSISWVRDVAAYTDKAASIFTCPSAKKPSSNPSFSTGYGTSDQSWRWDWSNPSLKNDTGLEVGQSIGYSYSKWASYPEPDSIEVAQGHLGQSHWKTSYCWKTPSNIKDAANTPLLADGRWMYGLVDDQDVPQQAEDEDWLMNSDKWGVNMFMIDRHKGPSVNILYADNSARNTPLKDIFTLKWHKEYNVRNDYVTDPSRLPDWLK